MKHKIRPTLLLLFLFGSNWLPANSASRDSIAEHKYQKQLEDLNPALVKPFIIATEALDRKDLMVADSIYRQIDAKLPDFEPVLRRLAFVRFGMGKRSEAIDFADRAIALHRSPDNLYSLAWYLAVSEGKKNARKEELSKAFDLLREAEMDSAGNEPRFLIMSANIARELERNEDWRTAVKSLQRVDPDGMTTHYYLAVIAAEDEHWADAEAEIHKAEAHGLSHEIVQSFLDSGVRTKAQAWQYGGLAIWIIAGWSLGLLMIYTLGKTLSGLTLSSIGSGYPASPISESERRLRRLYRVIINIAGIYYYVSLPVVVLIVIAAAAGLLFLCLYIGQLPIGLLYAVGAGSIVTIYKMIHSLFIKIPRRDPGRALEREEAPGFWKLTSEVADALHTRPIDEIRLTPSAELAVYERGSRRERMQDRARRILIFGVANLKGFKESDLRAILAHEYGHFSHRDTAGGDIALRVQEDMTKFYVALFQAGQATYMNVAVHFLRMYNVLFRRITHGATRLQEILADRVAAQQYGAIAFQDGLTHVIRRDIEFTMIAKQEIENRANASGPMRNLYTLEPGSKDSVESELQKALNRPTKEDDTHPSPMDRFRLLDQISGHSDDDRATYVWDLFEYPEELTKEMTQFIERMTTKN